MPIKNTLISSALVFSLSFCHSDKNAHDIEVLPNQGIKMNGNEFILGKTPFEQTLLFFKIKDTLTEYSATAEMYDSEGNSLPCIETFQKRVDIQNVSFYFTGQKRNSLALTIIEIRLRGPLTAVLDGKRIENTLTEIPANYPNSIRFPSDAEDIHNTILFEDQSQFGITFWVDSLNNSIMVRRLFIQKKQE